MEMLQSAKMFAKNKKRCIAAVGTFSLLPAGRNPGSGTFGQPEVGEENGSRAGKVQIAGYVSYATPHQSCLTDRQTDMQGMPASRLSL